ncbi:MAG: SDR family NAD(P)-dependent oxidoreductase, partial [Cohnella sp.]|nr:SDR family NAD(P)-dependent oxidoreductase [Cohnella sp.]
MSLSGKVTIVTGGARGIGRATCIQLARQGAKVVVNDFGNDHAAESVASEIRAAGGEAISIQADVRSAEQVGSLVETV